MDKDKQTDNRPSMSLTQQEMLCHIITECHAAYSEDVTEGGMSYDNFSLDFFGPYGIFSDSGEKADLYRDAFMILREHRPIIEYRFRSSVFTVEDALAMLQELGHTNSLFDRYMIDVQLRSIIPKLEKDGMLKLLADCANSVAMFHEPVEPPDMMSMLTGRSRKDYGIYNVSHFAYFMKKLENTGMTIQHWQSMVWNLSRIVYRGRYLSQHLISSTVHNITFLKRRPWQYDTIDEWMADVRRMTARH